MIRTFISTAVALVTFTLPIVASAQQSPGDSLRTYRSNEHFQLHQTAPNSGSLRKFKTVGPAQRHCPSDTVVWLNTSSHIWYLRGERYFGNTKQGAYVCTKEAAAAGNRGKRNGR